MIGAARARALHTIRSSQAKPLHLPDNRPTTTLSARLEICYHPDVITVLFDGVCNLCNRWVDFIIRRDSRHLIRFAAQQSAAGQKLLATVGMTNAAGLTIVVIDDPRIYTRSAALLRVARALPAPWPLFTVLAVIPPFLRDPLYNIIARHRTRWFGQRPTCRVPTPEERANFLE